MLELNSDPSLSDDGNTVVGRCLVAPDGSNSTVQIFYWTTSGGMSRRQLPYDVGGNPIISGNGQFVVATMNTPDGYRPFRYEISTGNTITINYPLASAYFNGTGVSFDGRILAFSLPSGSVVVWKENSGVHDLSSLLPNNTGWTIQMVNAMSTNADAWVGTGTFNGLTQAVIIRGMNARLACDSIDFNQDGSLYDPQDIEAFLSVYSEGPCVPASATCNDIDFNNDTSLFDPCDINSFLVMYSQGPCTPCGV